MKRLYRIFSSYLFLGKEAAQAVAEDRILPPEEAWEMISGGALLVDCRSAQEVSKGTLPGALNIPHFETQQRLAEFGADRESLIVVFCAVGGRSGVARNLLIECGFNQVHNAGGFGELYSYALQRGLFGEES